MPCIENVADATKWFSIVKCFSFGSGEFVKRTAADPAKLRKQRTAAAALRTRQEHAQETAQDYVELIAELIAETGEARAIDLARRLGVTHVTVGRTIQRLQRNGYVTAQPYRSIFLTDTGRKLAEEARRRHQVVFEFLRSLGVPEPVAHSDAEGIEHHVSPETLSAFRKHLDGHGKKSTN
jgi:DtxR family manganese transport transcriptional regulator